MSFERALYNLLLPAAGAWAKILARFNDKIAEGIEGRRGIRERWLKKVAGLDPAKRTIWFHVSSVGEFLQARPVMDLLAEKHGGNIHIALTFFSPSGMNYFEKHDRSSGNASLAFVDYLPIDTVSNVRFCLETLKPDMIVYVKFDLWPNLIIEAGSSGIPQILVSGTLSPSSKRLSGPARRFYGSLYSTLDAIAAISDEDAERFSARLGGETEIVTAGDTRFDQVCQRVDTSTVKIPGAVLDDERDLLIAGSSWPRDEAIVIPGFARILETRPRTAMIVAPHEPTPARLAEIEESLSGYNLRSVRLSALERWETDTPVVIADGVGYLAELYRAGDIAYVGGSWTTGVHNVMEPAVLGLPVFFGPRIDNSWEAGMLVRLGAGKVVSSPEEFASGTAALLGDRGLLASLGEKASGFIRESCGAAPRCLDLIERYIDTGKAHSDR
jgi:3-deoxy-D-manno-octulosonic-acid transferase